MPIEEACAPAERDAASVTRSGMQELGRLFSAAKPDVVIVATPHNVHISNAIGVIVAARLAGSLEGPKSLHEPEVPCAHQPAWGALQSLAAAGLPAAAVSFGSNDPASAVAPMDWGVLIPL